MGNLEKAKQQLNKEKIKIIKDISEAPQEIIDEIREAQRNDIIDRYDNPDYYDNQIEVDILEDHGYQIK